MDAAAVGVVAFDPRQELIVPLVSSVLKDAGCAFVFVNGIADEQVLARLRDLGPRCRIIKAAHNLGVAEALNMIALHAIFSGYSRVAFFDQDSRPSDGLIKALQKGMSQLLASGERVAVVGPAITAPRQQSRDFKSPRYFIAGERQPVDDLVPVRYVITSGSLVDLTAFRSIGKFRSDFFIDSIDTEWCFRSWAKGYSCWYVPSVEMEHTVGEGLLLGRFPRQKPSRMYSWFRNQCALMTLPHVPLVWKARFALYAAVLAAAVMFDAKFNLGIVRSIGRACVDGWKGRLGPPPGASRAVKWPSE